MQILRILRRRFALRYSVVILVITLVAVSFHHMLWSDQAVVIFENRTVLLHRDFGSGLSIRSRKETKIDTSSITYGVADNWGEYQRNPSFKTGNKLIDNYGLNDDSKTGENGRGVSFTGKEKEKVDKLMKKYNLNVYASDLIPLNRKVPDSRFSGCANRTLPQTLLTASIVIPFYDEWPSMLLRTVYSIVNRSPRKWLHEIILVDDNSTMVKLKPQLTVYIETHFPMGLVKLIRLPERTGLIQARLMGFKNATGDVIVFLDSHMEVNTDWLEPLLEVVSRDRKTVAMGILDYIQWDSMEYRYYHEVIHKYGFNWKLAFFETFFRHDQLGKTKEDIRIGTVMVGAAFAIDKKFFEDIGTYDDKMKVWGGENLELAWRIWLCGGKLVHVPCSHIGHVARSQPYSFPGGRNEVEQFNYKRAVEVWMEPQHKELIYHYIPNMKALDVGDLSDRLALKEKLQCKPFSWFMKNIWPELFVMNENVRAWGSARNINTNTCLDNHGYLYQAPNELFDYNCHYFSATQVFAITNDGLLRTMLQCVVLKHPNVDERPMLEDCIIGLQHTWTHHQGSQIQHDASGLCLDLNDNGPIMKTCNKTVKTQLWQFNTYINQ